MLLARILCFCLSSVLKLLISPKLKWTTSLIMSLYNLIKNHIIGGRAAPHLDDRTLLVKYRGNGGHTVVQIEVSQFISKFFSIMVP